jgi:hypothetical protein
MKSGTALHYAAAENPTISRSVTADISGDDGAGKRYFMHDCNGDRLMIELNV